MATSGFAQLAAKLAAPKGPNVTTAFRPREGGGRRGTTQHFYGKRGSNAGPYGGRYGIGGVPGWQNYEPRIGRPKVGGRGRYSGGRRYNV